MSKPPKVPFLDLVAPHKELRSELLAIVDKAFDTAGFIGGPMVEEFEQEFAAFCHTKYCVGVNSGTDALRFAFIAGGIGEGDVVITVPNTFIATTEAISQAGASITFVDIDERTYTMDPIKLREYLENNCDYEATSKKLIERKSKKRVAAIVPVHLYGQTADMDPILDLAQRFNLLVIEDACQAHGAEYHSEKDKAWKRAGSMGLAAAFSFYPGKNLGACGEGGAITTNDLALAQRMKMIRDHGQAKKYYHDIEGYNGRLDSIQAGWLTVKLRHLEDWNKSRRSLAHRYNQLLGELKDSMILPIESTWTRGVFHLYVVRVQDREAFQAFLREAGIGTGIHYPVPLHLQKAYEHMGHRLTDFPVTERVARETVSLPIFPQMTDEQQDETVKQIKEYVTAQVQSRC
ncbi:MAG TPA: DegT/DnrJ/EryC1/StrS family aminotransferase [Candidatus Sulfotelmatobacter sp.]|nr:DegT/DnrJ/EryC1/StrS family aminotransferase [Candidatus Sulfotelmatobacter sp.]